MRQYLTSVRPGMSDVGLFLLIAALVFALLSGCGGGIYVETPKLLGVSIESENNLHNLSLGQTHKLLAIGRFNDEKKRDISEEVIWSLEDEGVVSLEEEGNIKALKPGKAKINIVHPKNESLFRASFTISVSPTLTKIEIVGETDEMAEEETQSLKVIGHYSNGDTNDISSVVTWSINEPNLASIDKDNTFQALQQGTVLVTAHYNAFRIAKEIIIIPLYENLVATPNKAKYYLDDTIEINIEIGLIEGGKIDVSDKTSFEIDPPNLVRQVNNNSFLITGTGFVNILTEFKGRTAELSFNITPPLQLFAKSASETQINLGWKSQNADSYVLYWDTQSGVSEDSPSISDLTSESYLHDNIDFSKDYYYRLAYVKDGQRSELSEEFKVSPLRNEWAKKYVLRYANAKAHFDYPAATIRENVLHVVSGKESPKENINQSSAIHIELNLNDSNSQSSVKANTEVSKTTSCTHNGIMYLIGGETNLAYTNIIQAYDFTSETWNSDDTSLNTLSIPAFGLADCAIINENIYVFGGYNSIQIFNHLFKYDTQSRTWATVTQQTPLDGRYGHGLVSIGSTLYSIGGSTTLDDTGISDELWAFDTSIGAGQWQQLKSMNHARLNASYLVYDNRIYAFGGKNGSSVLETVEVYSPQTDSWQILQNMPSPRFKHTAVVVNETAMLVGGSWRENTDDVNENYQESKIPEISTFDLVRHQWLQKAPLPLHGEKFTSQIVDGTLYRIGGWDSAKKAIPTVENFDVNSNQWIGQSTPMPYPRVNLSSAILENSIVVAGGKNDSHVSMPNVDVYNPQTDSWISLSSLKKESTSTAAFSSTAVCTWRGEIFVFGGYDSQSKTASNAVYHYIENLNDWKPVASMPTKRYEHHCQTVGNRIYVLGGRVDENNAIANMDIYNPLSDEWHAGMSMSVKRSAFGSTIINGDIIIIGGRSLGDELTSVERFSLLENKWYSLPPLPIAKSFIHAHFVNGQILVLGDELESRQIDIYH